MGAPQEEQKREVGSSFDPQRVQNMGDSPEKLFYITGYVDRPLVMDTVGWKE
jgi:hypothetical protein